MIHHLPPTLYIWLGAVALVILIVLLAVLYGRRLRSVKRAACEAGDVEVGTRAAGKISFPAVPESAWVSPDRRTWGAWYGGERGMGEGKKLPAVPEVHHVF